MDALKALKDKPPVEIPSFSSQRVENSDSNRLQKAAFGIPDDLKRIKGVGPKLEKMLHGIGVYYFWQVADWQSSDIAEVDALLEAFTGRIERDEWVRQAGQLAREPNSAQKP